MQCPLPPAHSVGPNYALRPPPRHFGAWHVNCPKFYLAVRSFMPASRKFNKTIMIVDDEDSDLKMSCQILLREGYTVLEADCYRRAISVIEDDRYSVDFLVADVSLPDGDACDLAFQLMDRQPELRVLFVSGHAGAEICRFYRLDQTGLHFLRKPFTAKQLSESVQGVLNAAVPFPQLRLKNRTAS